MYRIPKLCARPQEQVCVCVQPRATRVCNLGVLVIETLLIDTTQLKHAYQPHAQRQFAHHNLPFPNQ